MHLVNSNSMTISYNSKRTHLVIVEGNVGAGKSTLLQIMEEDLSSIIKGRQVPYVPLYEDVPEDFPTYMRALTQFYKTGHTEYDADFFLKVQLEYLDAKVDLFKKAQQQLKTTNVAIERSHYADYGIFFLHLYDLKLVDQEHVNTYGKYFHDTTRELPTADLLAMLEIHALTGAARTMERDREGEEGIGILRHFLFGHRYKDWFDTYHGSPKIKIPYDEFDPRDSQTDRHAVFGHIIRGLENPPFNPI